MAMKVRKTDSGSGSRAVCGRGAERWLVAGVRRRAPLPLVHALTQPWLHGLARGRAIRWVLRGRPAPRTAASGQPARIIYPTPFHCARFPQRSEMNVIFTNVSDSRLPLFGVVLWSYSVKRGPLPVFG